MKKLTALTLILALQSASGSIEVIYGEDNRKDVYQTSNALHLKLAEATAGMVHLSQFEKADISETLNIVRAPTLEVGQNICPSEAFSQQLTASTCSGFLVGPDTLVTAGHCYLSFAAPETVCKSFAWVFDFNMKSESHDPSKGLQIKDIYLCKQVVAAKLDGNLDYAVIKLHRPVTGRSPLKFRKAGKVSASADLVVVGHPSGLPTKIADAGKVTHNKEKTRFSTTLDTFQGNSGSAVFDANTGLLEGILIQGKTDYRPSIAGNETSCKVVNVCDEAGSNCSAGSEPGPVASGEVVLRITATIQDINKALKL